MKRSNILAVLAGLAALVGLYLTSLYSYVLFHSIAELVGIAIAFGVFLFAWNSRHLIKNNYLLFLGISYVFVAVIAIIHTLSYRGMGIFPNFTSDPPTQLWIASRYLLSLSYLIAPFLFGKKLNPYFIFAGYGVVTTLLLLSILVWHVFPTCYIEGVGLTPFKKVSEFIISGILLLAAGAVWRQRRYFEKTVHWLLTFSILFTVLAELSFTQYISVFGPANMIGHLLSVVAFYLVYLAIIVTGFRRPVEILFRDLSATNKALSLNEEKFRTVAEFTHSWEYWMAPDGHIIYMSPSCERISSYKREEFIIDPGLLLAIVKPDDRSIVGNHFAEVSDDRPFDVDFRIVTRSGEERWLSHSCQAVFGSDGRWLGRRCSNRDITQRKKADLVKDDFIGMVSHELRTPITIIMGSLATAKTPGLSQVDQDELLGVAEESAKSMAGLVENLLELSRCQSDQINLTLEPVNLQEVAECVVKKIRVAYPRHVFKAEIAETLSRPRADRLRVERILYNLVDNAAKYSPEGSEVRLTANSTKDAVSISVWDQGNGIAENQRQRLFEPFSRLDNMSGMPGLGLGLVVCKRLAEAHGGSIRVESAPGQGSIFALTLPL